MRTAATIEVTIPESRKLELALPADVPAGAARLVVLVDEATSPERLAEIARRISLAGAPSDEPALSPAEHARLWAEWAASDDQGPISDADAGT